VEPEGREAVEHLAFSGDGIWQNAVEGRYPVGCNKQKILSEIEDFTDFAAAEFLDAGQVAVDEIHDEKLKAES
jgi:hypothetical protein